MKHLGCSLLRRWAWLAGLAVCVSGGAGAAELKLGGTGNALGTIRLLTEGFVKANPGVTPVILPSIGTSGALKALPKGAIDIGLSSRKPTEEEAKAGLQAIEYARSPTVFAIQAKMKTEGLTLQQVADIYAGRLTTWPDGSRIRPVMRQPGDDNTRQIKSLSPAIEKAVNAAEQQVGLAFASNDQEAADKMESIPGSLGVTTVALIRSEKRALKPLALDGIEPTADNLRTGRYPMVKHFYFIMTATPSPVAQAFVDYVRSPAGQRILEQAGNIAP